MTTNLPTPLTFLWSELDTLLSDATLAELRKRVAAHTDRYNRAAKIRQAERELDQFQRRITTKGPGSPAYMRLYRQIERRKARIKMLQDEENVTG